MIRLAHRLKIALSIAFLVLSTLGCIWQHVRLIGSGYEIERLRTERRALLQERRALMLEVASLSALNRIETLALGRLNMIHPEEGQMVFVRSLPPVVPKGAPKSRETRLARREANGE